MTSAERSKKWREDHPDYWVKKNSERRKKYAEDPEHRQFVIRRGILARYKMSPAQYDAKLEEQGGHCALCPATHGVHKLHVDHDHNCCTKKFTCGECRRGILCSVCNIRLAALEEILKEGSIVPTPGSWLARAMEYLDSYAVQFNFGYNALSAVA